MRHPQHTQVSFPAAPFGVPASILGTVHTTSSTFGTNNGRLRTAKQPGLQIDSGVFFKGAANLFSNLSWLAFCSSNFRGFGGTERIRVATWGLQSANEPNCLLPGKSGTLGTNPLPGTRRMCACVSTTRLKVNGH